MIENTEPLTRIPAEMRPWNMQLITPQASEFGQFALVAVEQASIETHHQVVVINESGLPMRGVNVIFGFDTGPNINLPVRVNSWPNAPVELKGNLQRTDGAGYCQHTLGEGGETIFVYDTNKEGDLLYPSAIVRNATWVGTPAGRFNHTGVCLTFQLLRVGVKPLDVLLAEFDQRLNEYEAKHLSG